MKKKRAKANGKRMLFKSTLRVTLLCSNGTRKAFVWIFLCRIFWVFLMR